VVLIQIAVHSLLINIDVTSHTASQHRVCNKTLVWYGHRFHTCSFSDHFS